MEHAAPKLHPNEPSCSEDMIRSVNCRLQAMEGSHAASEFIPNSTTGTAGTSQHLNIIGSRLTRLEDAVQLHSAMICNSGAVARNNRTRTSYEPLRKTIPGDGFYKACAVTSGYAQCPRGSDNQRNSVIIGALPPEFESTSVQNLSARDIADLISFYNEDFGIVANDDDDMRRDKFVQFLTRF
ncbi:hypothetical protein BDN70DRAFT_363854 [Pholiota conissans]|uniref:Uncharacterized protein n=1 Tax=Pholiota conissans TaxID=109636 RepID=A0A9P5YR74_9AGAR|nr:hypothetical protein BDN70DRAFT_363854 [Pholiota conissans]